MFEGNSTKYEAFTTSHSGPVGPNASDRQTDGQLHSAPLEREGRLIILNKLVRLIAVTVCGPANVNKTKDTTRPQG